MTDDSLITRAISGNTHYPANGARVIIGWIWDDGSHRFTDEPVLWFDNEGPAVTAGATGVETLTITGTSMFWSVYHPDARGVGHTYDPAAAAKAEVERELTRRTAARPA